MITFSCPNCGKRFSVPDDAAGKAGKCKACDARVQVPAKQDDDVVVMLEAVPAKPRPAPAAPRPAPARSAPQPAPQTIVDPLATDPFAGPDPFANDPFAAPIPMASAAPYAPAPYASDPFASAGAFPAVDPLSSGPASPSGAVRARRLKAEAEQIAKVFKSFPPISVAQVVGNPPESYRILYRIRGLQRGPNRQPVFRTEHMAEFVLTRDYPRVGPKCTMLTPVFHPNIEPATICVGDHWTAGQRLVDIIIRVGEMIAFQSYNIQSPLDGEAAMWADLNREKLPIDPRSMLPPDLE